MSEAAFNFAQAATWRWYVFLPLTELSRLSEAAFDFAQAAIQRGMLFSAA